VTHDSLQNLDGLNPNNSTSRSCTERSITTMASFLRSLALPARAFMSRQPISALVGPIGSATAWTPSFGTSLTRTGGGLLQQVQTRGMKVHSSVKKRCEHCKVSEIMSLQAWITGEASTVQSLRTAAGRPRCFCGYGLLLPFASLPTERGLSTL
jgi:large subunit ribosomal protein L36